MTSAAVLFYGRRSRTSRSFDDLGFGSLASSPFSTSSSSSSSTTTTTTSSDSNICYNHRHRHHHNHRRGDLHRRHRQINFDDPDNSRHSSNALHPSARLSLPGSELHHGSNDELPPHDINNRETVRGPGGRYKNGNRLPGSVLLAKERLVQRLRGVSVSRNRENRETSASVLSNPLIVVDAHWVLTELPIETHHHSAFREQQSKPLGLGHEALSQLHHEVFTKPQITTTLSTSEASNECSICLESFVEGNKLVNLPCGHRFHSSCLYPWLQTCGECPYCRSSIMLK